MYSLYTENYGSCVKSDFIAKKSITVPENTGFVYVIGNEHMKICKIGYSVNPHKRISAIQTGCPYPIEIIAIVKGSREMEKALHRKYVMYKTSGEWFRYEGKLKESIKQIKV